MDDKWIIYAMEYYLAINKELNFAIFRIWMDPESTLLSELRYRQIPLLHVESKQKNFFLAPNFIDTEKWLVVVRGKEYRMGEMRKLFFFS